MNEARVPLTLSVMLVLVAAVAATAQELPGAVPEGFTLQAATNYALRHSPELAAMQQEVAMAEAGLRLARAGDRWQASGNAYLSTATSPGMVTAPREVMPDDMRMADSGRWLTLDARASKPLATGGRVAAAVARRQGLLTATAAELQALRLRVSYEVRAKYRATLLAHKLVEVYQREVAAREEMLRVDEVKLEAGKIPLYYYLRDKTTLAEARQSLANTERDLEVALYQLSTALGLPPQRLTLTDSLGFVPGQVDAATQLRQAATRRPELAAVRARIEAAAAQTQGARAAYRPQLSATIILDWMTGRDEEQMSRGGYTAALVASLPLVDAGTRAAEVAMAEAQHRQLTAQERQLLLQVAQEVLSAVASLKAADQNIRTSLEAQASAEEDYRIARLRYDAGKAINLEPLDALAALVRARVNAARALYEYNNALDELQRAGGTPAPTPDDGTPASG